MEPQGSGEFRKLWKAFFFLVVFDMTSRHPRNKQERLLQPVNNHMLK